MASWDTPAVPSPTTANYAAPLVDFSKIANLPKDYYAAQEIKRQDEKATVFRNGIPRVGDSPNGPNDPNAPIDVNAVTDKLARINPDYAMPLINLQMQGQQGAAAADAIRNPSGAPSPQASQPQPYGTPAPSPRATTPVPGSVASSAPSAAQPTVMTILAAQGVPNDQLEAAAGSVSRQLGVGPTDPIDTKDPQVRNVLVPAIQRLKGVGQPVAAPQDAATPQDQPPAAPNDRVAQGFGDIPPAAQKDMADATAIRARAASMAAFNPKGAEVLNKEADAREARAHQTIDAAAPAPAIKEWRQSGSKLPYDEWVAQAEADKATAGERAKADVKEQQTYIDAGKQAGSRLTTLNTIGNIVNSDKNLTLGFGADTALKIKMALQQLGVPVGDLSGAEGIQKMNAALASEMAKSLSGRPTQFEFKSFMANNPGLLLDKSGNQRLIGIYSQLAQREYQLGKMARQSGDNWQNWDNVVEKYDAQHPIVDPISKQPISTNSVIAPGPQKAAAPAPAAPAQEGAMAINPKTGERLKLQGGKWVPFA